VPKPANGYANGSTNANGYANGYANGNTNGNGHNGASVPYAQLLLQAGEAVQNIRLNLPDITSIFIVDVETGLLERGKDRSSGAAIEIIAGYYTQVLRQERRALQAVGADYGRMKNMVFQTSRQYHALYPLAGQRFLCVIADQSHVNLSMMWRLLSSFAPQLIQQ
jgi:predicted regulator of Ras-like GTPase activity (Roadblock/LC7/MglB family)